METIEKFLVDIILISPINNNLDITFSERGYSLKESLIFFRKYTKSNKIIINNINELCDELYCLKQNFDHYLNIHYIIEIFLHNLHSSYHNYCIKGNILCKNNLFQEALKYMNNENDTLIL